ncbi:hypothetical protein GGF46_005050 [Coemansia sp. RSA 552]|nr:hypothetical protein GGF46_005050 [Coemansia sp. RSA 552]
MKLLSGLAALAALGTHLVLAAHIRKDLVQIKNDIIVAVDATAVVDSSEGRVAHLSISPSGPLIGARGVVYALPELVDCQPARRSKKDLVGSYIRVALISDDDDCPVEAKVVQAQYDGAVGALVYNATLDAPGMRSILHSRMARHKPKIPIMAVDSNYGETLKLEVATLLDESWNAGPNPYRAIFASLYSTDEDEHLNVWEITLISLVALLALGFCASLLFRISPRIRGRTGTGPGNNGLDGLGKATETLPLCALDRLVLRTISESDVEVLAKRTTPLDAILSPNGRVKGSRSCSSGHLTEHSASVADTKSTVGDPVHEEACAPDSTPDSTFKSCIATCIVCIDDFVAGSKMRILPCGHNYHIECIDPWLTSKSSLCPLCKYDTRNVLTDLERICSRTPRGLEDNSDHRTSMAGSEPSSYLAESRAHLPVSRAMRSVARVARQISAPLRALTRKAPRRARGQEDETQVMVEIPMDFQSAAVDCPSTKSRTIVPITYTMNIGGDDKPGLVEHSQKRARPYIPSTEKTSEKQTDTGPG